MSICFPQHHRPPSQETLIKEYNFGAAADLSPKPQYERLYNSFSAAADPPQVPQYERQRLDDLDFRSKDVEIQEDCRDRGWKQHNMAEKPHQEFLLPSRSDAVEHASSTRRLYEG